MKIFMKNSYERQILWIMFSMVLLCIVSLGIKSYGKRKLYEVYLDNKPVAVTAYSPAEIEKTYKDVKALRYLQGVEQIEEQLFINETVKAFDEEIANQEELAEIFYLELDNEEPVLQGDSFQSYMFEREYDQTCDYVEDNSLYVGESRVLQEGKKGRQRITVLKTFYNGQQIKERVIENEIITEPVPRVIAVGTMDRPDYVVPVDDYVFTSEFGPRWGTVHQGIDLAVAEGTSVVASEDGVVVQSGWNSGYGISVYVDHGNGMVTRYAHLSEACVKVGSQVVQGEKIGYSGNTGNSTGPHLHFEIRKGNEAVNPLDYLQLSY